MGKLGANTGIHSPVAHNAYVIEGMVISLETSRDSISEHYEAKNLDVPNSIGGR